MGKTFLESVDKMITEKTISKEAGLAIIKHMDSTFAKVILSG